MEFSLHKSGKSWEKFCIMKSIAFPLSLELFSTLFHDLEYEFMHDFNDQLNKDIFSFHIWCSKITRFFKS